MKHKAVLMALVLAGAVPVGAQTPEIDQLKADLVGQTMGGRERCWKFQSVGQIQELAIKDKTEDTQRRVYVVALRLQAAPATEKYAAEARVEYAKTAGGWSLKQVGLLSLAKME
jgi:hypothetical protein